MTQATSTKPRSRIIRRDRPIIERPRLIKKLDECDARTILLLAPAGYGKTTLARQWANTLSRVIWVSLTSAHRDVTVLARDLARSIEELGDEGFADFMDQFLRARRNPQKEATEIGIALADALNRIRMPWLVLDDYHELVGVPEAESLVEELRRRVTLRTLVATRARPRWATHRERLYEEIVEITQADLAMDDDESIAVVGREGPRVAHLMALARGWPAAIGLAARVEISKLPKASLPHALHGFLAEELFACLSEPLQDHLTRLALLPSGSWQELLGSEPSEIECELETILDGQAGLHPLLREFLLTKLAEEEGGEERVREAVASALDNHEWSTALALIERFSLHDMIDRSIRACFRPLIRRGQVWTLTEFVASCLASTQMTASGPMSLVLAQAAHADGHYDLARQLAARARRQMSKNDPLRPAAALVLAQAANLEGDYVAAQAGYSEAQQLATDDAAEALYALASQATLSESGESRHLEALRARRDQSPLDLVRYVTAEINRQRLSPGGYGDDGLIAECLQSLSSLSDPLASTSARWTFAYAYLLQTRHREASELLDVVQLEADSFRLSFIFPFINWLRAAISLGQRDFGACNRYLTNAERSMEGRSVVFHHLNIQALRARLYMQTGRHSEALACVMACPGRTIPSMRAEYLATRAFALATLNKPRALDVAAEACALSSAAEVQAYVVAATSLVRLRGGDVSSVVQPFEHASATRVWDPLISLLRAAPDFAAAAVKEETTEPVLRAFCERIDDRPLARQINLRIHPTSAPADGRLSQRENEVLGLISLGFKNQDIARTLYISESTVKVHVRHIFEKLGVRTRAEAAARAG